MFPTTIMVGTDGFQEASREASQEASSATRLAVGLSNKLDSDRKVEREATVRGSRRRNIEKTA